MAFENVLFIVIIIGVLLFGAKKLPMLARALGRAQAEFEKGKRESIRETSQETNDVSIVGSDNNLFTNPPVDTFDLSVQQNFTQK
jgi:sec-independent protein translocase protein TatA